MEASRADSSAAPNVTLDDGRSMFVGIRVAPDVSSSGGSSRPERVGTLAFRRPYGGSVVLTLVKETGIATIYIATSVVAFATTIYIVSVIG